MNSKQKKSILELKASCFDNYIVRNFRLHIQYAFSELKKKKVLKEHTPPPPCKKNKNKKITKQNKQTKRKIWYHKTLHSTIHKASCKFDVEYGGYGIPGVARRSRKNHVEFLSCLGFWPWNFQ